MTWSPTRLPSYRIEPRLSDLRPESSERVPSLATLEAQVLDAMGIAVVALDANFRIVLASSRARAALARIAPPDAPEALPEPMTALVKDSGDAAAARWRSPARIVIGGRTFSVWARPVELAWASYAVWFRAEGAAGDLDEVLRRRWKLTPRQIDLVHQLRSGIPNREIARNLGLTHSTVKSYLSHLFDQLGVRSRAEAIVFVERIGRGEA